MTLCVSIRTSRSCVSPTSVFAAGAASAAATGATVAGIELVAAPADASAIAVVVVADACPPGFGTGLTKSACHTYTTRKARKIARRTRRSISFLLSDVTAAQRHGVV